MASTPSKAIDQATRHALHVERLKSHDVNVLREMLQDIEDTLVARIARSKPESWTRGEMERRLAAYREMIGQKYADDIIPELNRQIGELALNEAQFEIKNLDSVVQNYQFSLPTENQIMTAIRSNPLQLGGRFKGSLLGGLIDDFEENQIRVMTNTIRAGYAGGETTQQIISRLQQEAFPIAKRDLESVVRTSLQHSAGQARQATYQANSDIIKGYRIVATLDGRTCLLGHEKILMADGSQKRIDEIKKGEFVLSGTLQKRLVCGTLKKANKKIVKVTLDSGDSVYCTPDHLWLTKNGGWVEAQNLKGHELMEPGGQYARKSKMSNMR